MQNSAPQSTNLDARDGLRRVPCVSVIIPVYKAAAFIAEALDSVFAQTLQNFEVILVNDGSPDTEELDRALQPYVDRITYLQQPNRGPAAARNAGIRCAGGDYVAFLDSDDAWEPEFLVSQVRLLESQKEIDLVYANLRMFGDSPRAGKTYMQECPSEGPATFESIAREDCHVPTSGTLVRKRALTDAGLFDESPALRGVEDYDMWLRIAWRGGQILYQQTVLGKYRLHPGSISAAQQAMLEKAALVLAKLGRELELSPRQRCVVRCRKAYFEARANVMRAKHLLAHGEIRQARDCLEKAGGVLGSFKIRLALLALRIAPRLAKAGVVLWGRALQARSRL